MGNNGLDRSDINRGCEECFEFCHSLEIEETEFPNGLDVGCEIKQAKMFQSFWPEPFRWIRLHKRKFGRNSAFHFGICQVWTLERLVFSSKEEFMARHVNLGVIRIKLIFNSIEHRKLEEIIF